MTASASTWHTIARGGLGRLAATTGPAGVVIGRDHAGDLAPIRLFRLEATRVLLVGGSWLERLVVFRCLGAGARVEIATATPSRWADVGALAGAADRVTTSGGSDGWPAPGSMRPLLRVNDVGLGGGVESEPLGPWEALLTVAYALTGTSVPLLAEANVVVLHRLTPDEAKLCASTLHLPEGMETKLGQMHDDMVAVVVGGVARFLWFATTSTEEELLGQPRRSAPDAGGLRAAGGNQPLSERTQP